MCVLCICCVPSFLCKQSVRQFCLREQEGVVWVFVDVMGENKRELVMTTTYYVTQCSCTCVHVVCRVSYANKVSESEFDDDKKAWQWLFVFAQTEVYFHGFRVKRRSLFCRGNMTAITSHERHQRHLCSILSNSFYGRIYAKPRLFHIADSNSHCRLN